ncbi:unnamed protein product, partial [Mesorhabditis belari]|uniref:Vacuolar protein-sorting-associated protein 25 n=1 Tax=Mesorhabditis belari TaxID=2138241 RepID=A0AAF3EJX0_9BILA
MSFQFKWPWQYDFPPFFTLQPVLITREKQLEAWARLVIDYAQHNKLFTLDIKEAEQGELFHNTKLNRRLSPEGVKAVFEYLEQKKHLEWIDTDHSRCHIYWRTPEEWGALIFEWAQSNGLANQSCTLFEIAHGDDTVAESFHVWRSQILVCIMLSKSLSLAQCSTDSVDSAILAEINGPSFFRYADRIDEGDTVIVYVSFGNTYPVVVKRGITLNMKYGALRHEFIIGKPWGSRVSATAGYVWLLRPSSELWTRSLAKRTQIIYTPDIGMILQLLDIKPGSVICESGTGSGSLTHALGMAVYPTGHIYTHDIEESRIRKIEQEFKEHGLSSIMTAVVQNVCEEGFFVSNACDGVFLDVPAPWEAIPFAVQAISRTRGGRLVSFSPCIEQVQQTCKAMRAEGFVLIETVEIVPKSYKVTEFHQQSLVDFDKNGDMGSAPYLKDRARKRKLEASASSATSEDSSLCASITSLTAQVFPANQPTHTSYITHATMLPRLEKPDSVV